MEDKSIKTNGVGHNSAAFSESVADQAVRFVNKLSALVRSANDKMHYAINGKNTVERGISLRDVSEIVLKLVNETKDWHTVIETMKKGKDVHIQENCKHEKLEIVGGSHYNFGQYLIDKSDGKFCEQNPDLSTARAEGLMPRGNRSGKAYIEKVTREK